LRDLLIMMILTVRSAVIQFAWFLRVIGCFPIWFALGNFIATTIGIKDPLNDNSFDFSQRFCIVNTFLHVWVMLEHNQQVLLCKHSLWSAKPQLCMIGVLCMGFQVYMGFQV